ncbi:MAG: hypothetical protein AAGJ38_01375, partial [Planctomycetota bacterium]
MFAPPTTFLLHLPKNERLGRVAAGRLVRRCQRSAGGVPWMAADSNLIRRCTRRRVELVRRPHPPLPSRDRIAEPVRSLPLRRVPG